MSRLVIKHHSPEAKRRQGFVVGFVVLLLVWGLFSLGHWWAGFDLESLSAENARLQAENSAAQEENEALRQEKALLERSAEIAKVAQQQISEQLEGLEEDVAQLKGELAFYRGIVSPEDSKSGLTVQRFELHSDGDGRYRYTLVLTQVLNNTKVVRGKVRLSVDGQQGGEETSLGLKQLGGESDELAFRFKYFQIFEGELDVPEGFIPSMVKAVVDPSGQGMETLEAELVWPTGES